LQDRAKEFIATGNPVDQSQLLAECLSARNLDGLAATQRLFEDMYGGMTFNIEMKIPAAVCLISWGKEGIKALVEAATRTVSYKNNLITLQLLSALATGNLSTLFTTFVTSDTVAALKPSLQDQGVRAFARQQLTEFMLSFSDDDDASTAAGSVLQQLAFA